ncbi:tyrosine-type recombinase/integrase [Clostridium diolis]|uniref:Site-specific integrase n=1 Tax=Clostridium diolis TaxID=223919 RepID=A0AAV3W6F9_9CLOT|nr:site-specific integrase [Clostridium diolis]QES71599.1 site-specific integrase [Clostridium diolis]GEA33600.1 site-specific integrase [Clostridium diolis]
MANENIKTDKKTGLYYFDVSLGFDPATGKRRRTTRRGFKKKKDAEQAYNDLKNQYYDGVLTYNQSTKFKNFIDEYLKWYKTQVRKTTFDNRASSIKKNIIEIFGEYKLEQITPIIVQKWQQQLLDNGKDQNYVRSLHIALSQILERAVNLDVIKTNPAKKAGNVKRKRKEVEFWTEDELNKVLDTMKLDDTLQYFGYVMIKFLFYTGLRFSEMQALQWSDFDDINKSISITKDLDYRNQNDWDFDDTKNSTSNRLVVLDDDTFDMLLKWQEYQKTLFEVKKDTFIFSYDNGIPTNKHFPGHVLTRHSKLADIKRIKPHALRHSHASFLISLDVNIIAIAKRLGHKDVQEVLKTYGHLYPKHQFDVAENINTHIQNKKSGVKLESNSN